MSHAQENGSEMCEDNVDTGLMYYVQRIKLAVAIAIIQSTPSDQDPKEYTICLQQQFSNNISEWKNKYEILEEKVVQLNDKLATARLQMKSNEACPGLDACDDIFDVSDAIDSDIASNSLESKIKNNMEFVRNFLILNSVVACQNLRDEDNETSCVTVLKTVSNLLQMLKNEDSFKMDRIFARRAIVDIHRLLTLHEEGFSNKIIEMCQLFIDDLLLGIYKTIEINKTDELHHRSILIQLVAEHRNLTLLVLSRLLREITVYADTLENIINHENDNFLPILHAENSYFVLQSAEGVLNILKKQKSSLNILKVPNCLLTEWQKTTTKSLEILGLHFPMYTVYTWYIKSLVESIVYCGIN